MDDVVQVKHDAHPLPVRIKQLSNSVINKIAAGEVIERPASIVKELLENAIDADASRIDVQVANGGTDLIQVTDDGCGIHCDDLNLAVASHATSKIRDADDLFDVKSLGFRGEALASIAEISRFRLQSRTVDSECAYELEVQGGQLCDIRPCAGPVGTTVVVEQLFFNTPVRRKFLKTSQTEFGHVAEAFTRIALANPGVHFTLKHNEKLVYDLPAVLNWESRIAGFFGHELGEALIPVSSEIDGVSLAGFVVDPLHSRAHNRMQYLFLNGRCIRDRSLQHALSEAYRGLLLSGRQPICFLKLSMEADRVDVNVHPCKLEVRFQDGSRIYSQLLGTIRNKFLTTDLTARQNLQNLDDPSGTAAARNHAVGQTAIKSPPLPSGEAWTSSELGPNPQQRKLGLPAQKFDYDWTSGPRNPNAAQPSGNFQAQALPSADQLSGMPYSAVDMPRPHSHTHDAFGQPVPQPSHWNQHQHPQLSNELDSIERTHDDNLHAGSKNLRAASGGIQIHNRYLVTQSEEGIVVIDQHALHERVIYEQLRQRVAQGKLESQRLLVPQPVDLTPAEAAIVLDVQAQLATIGIVVEPFGGDTVLIQAYPAMLAKQSPAEILRGVIETLLNSPGSVSEADVIDELLHMISCKAAVKAGDKLSAEEIEALLQHRELCQNAHHCPHGRPTALIFSREELDKRFKRI